MDVDVVLRPGRAILSFDPWVQVQEMFKISPNDVVRFDPTYGHWADSDLWENRRSKFECAYIEIIAEWAYSGQAYVVNRFIFNLEQA